MANFLDGTPQIANEKTLIARWSGGSNGKYFRCYICGYKFILGDYWRFVFLNDLSYSTGNLIVCKKCDNEDREVLAKQYRQMYEESKEKYWSFCRND